jgi:predicted ester cyclase
LSECENEKIVEKIFEAWNRHDPEACMSHLSDDVKVVWSSGRTVDAEGYLKDMPIDGLGFPDSNWRVDRMISQGDTVCVE